MSSDELKRLAIKLRTAATEMECDLDEEGMEVCSRCARNAAAVAALAGELESTIVDTQRREVFGT